MNNFINDTDLKNNTVIQSNVDSKLLIPFIAIAEKIKIESILGTPLYNHLLNGYFAESLNADELKLVDEFIKVSLIYSTFTESLPFLHVRITNKGIVYKSSGEQSDTVDIATFSLLRKEVTNIAEFYLNRLVDFLCANSSKFPLYTNRYDSNTLDGTKITQNPFFSGLQF